MFKKGDSFEDFLHAQFLPCFELDLRALFRHLSMKFYQVDLKSYRQFFPNICQSTYNFRYFIKNTEQKYTHLLQQFFACTFYSKVLQRQSTFTPKEHGTFKAPSSIHTRGQVSLIFSMGRHYTFFSVQKDCNRTPLKSIKVIKVFLAGCRTCKITMLCQICISPKLLLLHIFENRSMHYSVPKAVIYW